MITEQDVDRQFKEGFDCSQIVFAAVAERLGLTREQAYAVASCFGIGMAQGETCGAATGAMMAIGLRYGNVRPGDFGAKSEVFGKRDEFIRRFAQMNGKVRCPDLLGRRVDTFDELMTFGATTDLFRNCRRYCVNAVTILEEML